MENVLIKTSSEGNTWSDLLTPSGFSIEWNDIDSDSYRSVVNGNILRNRISPRWVKLKLSYNKVTDAELDAIARAVNTNALFYVRCKCPAFGNLSDNTTWVQFQAYVSQYNAEMISGQVGWSLSFNIIQAKVGSFQ